MVAAGLWWGVGATQSATVTTTIGDVGCINSMSVDGRGWIATDSIPSEWDGEITGEFTWRFGSGSFDVDGTVVNYRRTDDFGPCIERTIAN